MQALAFSVFGTPIPKGSMKAFNGKTRPVVTHDNKRTKPWQKAIRNTCKRAMARHGIEMFDGPVMIEATFTFRRPKSVKREHMSVKPDLDKLQRNLGDALEGVLLTNDSRVTCWHVRKVYGEPEGVDVRVSGVE